MEGLAETKRFLKSIWLGFVMNIKVIWVFFASGRCRRVMKEAWYRWYHDIDENDKISDALLIQFKDLKLDKKIGEGGFGIVYQGTYRREKVAIKKVRNQLIGEVAIKNLLKEGKIHSRLRSKYVAQLLGVCTEKDNVCLVVEWMDKGNLRSILHNPKEVLPWSMRTSILHQIALGMNVLHGCRPPILHQDLKSANVLIDRHWQAKLCDFGISSSLLERMPPESAESDHIYGTVQWTAPELFLRFDCHQTKETDVYSFGILMWEIASRQDPFWNLPVSSIPSNVIKGNRPTGVLPPDVPPIWTRLMQDCWSQLPINRPTFEVIVSTIEDITDSDQTTNPAYVDNFVHGLEKLVLFQYEAANQLFLASHEQNTSFTGAYLGLCLSYELHPSIMSTSNKGVVLSHNSLSCDRFALHHLIQQAQFAGSSAHSETTRILTQLANGEYGTTTESPILLRWMQRTDAKIRQDVFAAHMMGMLKDHIQHDNQGAIEWYEKGAASNFRPSLSALSVMYLEGKGCHRDVQKAYEWAQKSVSNEGTLTPESPLGSGWCAKGAAMEATAPSNLFPELTSNPEANIEDKLQRESGPSTTPSRSQPKVLVEAYDSYLRGSQLQWAPCEYRVAVCLEYGRGVAADPHQALVYYLRAARRGYAEAQLRAGRWLARKTTAQIPHQGLSGSLVVPPGLAGINLPATRVSPTSTPAQGTAAGPCSVPESAALFLRRAGEQGCASAWAFLAEMYETGSGGVPKDLVEAEKLYKKAAHGGSQLGQRSARRLSDARKPFWSTWMKNSS